MHGFRTTASTLLNENGHPADVIEAALAHTKGDIRSIYNRALYLAEREKMYQWWGDYVDELRKSKFASTPIAVNNPTCNAAIVDFDSSP